MSQGQAIEFEAVIDALKRASAATRTMVEHRSDADDAARRAVDAVETALVRALDGEALRGLPELGDRLQGLRVDEQAKATSALPRGRAVLVLDRHGLLVVATLFGRSSAVHVQRAPRGVVRASHLPAYLNAVCRALEIHLQSAQDRTATFERVRALAGRVVTAATDL